MSIQALQQAAENRRSIYVLSKELPISKPEIAQIVEHAVKHTQRTAQNRSRRQI